MKTKNTTTIINSSLLSNGILISGHFPVGSMVSTQWGLRQVVKNISEKLRPEPCAEKAQNVQ